MTTNRTRTPRRAALALVGALALPPAGAGAGAEPLPAAQVAERLGLDEVLVSDWDAGFPATLRWRADHIRAHPGGGVALYLSKAPPGAPRPFEGAEFQTRGYEPVWGRVEWEARLPRAPSGSVAAMFLYKTPHDAPGNRELDFEYLPGDPKSDHPLGSMQMALHMAPAGGEREHTEYRIDVPERCVEASCGWAVEFQPDRVDFQLRETPGGDWTTVARFAHGAGWDEAAGRRLHGRVAGERNGFSGPGIWSEQPMKAFASYWASDDLTGWLGPLDAEALDPGAPPFVIKRMTLASYDRLPAPRDGDWSLAADGTVTLAVLPASDLEPTGIEYRVDGGVWRPLGPATPGDHEVAEPLPPGARVELRSVARGPAFEQSGHEVVSPPSPAKTAGSG